MRIRSAARAASAIIVVILLGACTDAASPSASASLVPASQPAVSAAATAVPAIDAPSPIASSLGSTPSPSGPSDLGFLPPNSRALVSVDSLRVRAEPTTTGQVVATLSAGDELLITASFDQWGPLVHEAIEWYPVVADGQVYGWVAGDQGGTELLEPAPIACSGAPDSAAILAMTPWERLVCIGDDTVTITGVTEVACQGGVRPDATYEPLWLANWCPIFALTNRESVAADPTARMILAFPPDFGAPFDGIDHGSIVEVSGHFDDPAAAECNVRPSLNEEWSQPAVRVLCREQFVVTDVNVKGHLDIPSPG